VSSALAFEFWLADRSLAGFAYLSIGARRAEYWAGLVRRGSAVEHPFILVKELEVQPPRRPGSWEIRAEGLWADHNCETPGSHWSFGLEAFGLGFDNAADALTSEWGDRVPLGFDLEWEPGVVHGDILLAGQTLPVTCISTAAGAVEMREEGGAALWERAVAGATRGGSAGGTA
jgi:hypothetical protein